MGGGVPTCGPQRLGNSGLLRATAAIFMKKISPTSHSGLLRPTSGLPRRIQVNRSQLELIGVKKEFFFAFLSKSPATPVCRTAHPRLLVAPKRRAKADGHLVLRFRFRTPRLVAPLLHSAFFLLHSSWRSSRKMCDSARFWCLKFGPSLELGSWCLDASFTRFNVLRSLAPVS